MKQRPSLKHRPQEYRELGRPWWISVIVIVLFLLFGGK
jgi:hypothetical protein